MASSSSVGNKILPIKSKSISHCHSCICGTRECAALTNCFQSISDARGCQLAVPPLDSSKNTEIKIFKVQQACHHLGLGRSNYEKYATVDNRHSHRQKRPLSPDAHAAAIEPTEEAPVVARKWIAAHHYHPQVIQLFVKENGLIWQCDHLTDLFVRENGLWGNGYAESDYFPGELKFNKRKKKERVFVPVPSYSHKDAMRDYRRVVTRYKLSDVVQKCKDAIDEEDGLRPEVQPLDKMDNEFNLEQERAVSLLAEDVQELDLQNEQLKQQLQHEKSCHDNAADEIRELNLQNGGLKYQLKEEREKSRNSKAEDVGKLEELNMKIDQLKRQLEHEKACNYRGSIDV